MPILQWRHFGAGSFRGPSDGMPYGVRHRDLEECLRSAASRWTAPPSTAGCRLRAGNRKVPAVALPAAQLLTVLARG